MKLFLCFACFSFSLALSSVMWPYWLFRDLFFLTQFLLSRLNIWIVFLYTVYYELWIKIKRAFLNPLSHGFYGNDDRCTSVWNVLNVFGDILGTGQKWSPKLKCTAAPEGYQHHGKHGQLPPPHWKNCTLLSLFEEGRTDQFLQEQTHFTNVYLLQVLLTVCSSLSSLISDLVVQLDFNWLSEWCSRWRAM